MRRAALRQNTGCSGASGEAAVRAESSLCYSAPTCISSFSLTEHNSNPAKAETVRGFSLAGNGSKCLQMQFDVLKVSRARLPLLIESNSMRGEQLHHPIQRLREVSLYYSHWGVFSSSKILHLQISSMSKTEQKRCREAGKHQVFLASKHNNKDGRKEIQRVTFLLIQTLKLKE